MSVLLRRTTTALRDLVDRLRGETPDPLAAPPATRILNQRARTQLGLRRQPFRDNAAAQELFVDDAVEMQLNMLSEHLRSGDMLPMLKGEPGSGKTSFLIQLMARTQGDFHYFVCRAAPEIAAERVIVDMLRVLVRPVPDDPGECFRQLARRLRDMVADGSPAALVVDDAHALSDRELGYLLIAHDSLRKILRGRFRLLLATDPSIELRISALRSEQIDAGQVFAANIRPLNRPRIGPYLECRLRMAGAPGELPLDDAALDRIAATSEGLPRGVETAATAELNALFDDD